MEPDIQRILEVIESLESRINAYWNFYIVIVVAAIGWLMSSQTPFTPEQGVVLTLALGLFFLANAAVLLAATRRALAMESELNRLAVDRHFASARLRAELARPSIHHRRVATVILHGAIDASVFFAIWTKLA